MEPDFKRARLEDSFRRFQPGGVISGELNPSTPSDTSRISPSLTAPATASTSSIPAANLVSISNSLSSSSTTDSVTESSISSSVTAAGSSTGENTTEKEQEEKGGALSDFYDEMKELESKNSSGELSRQHISRLTRPGATYFNLNPFDVLQLDPDTPNAECRKRYRQLVLLVHPDKNLSDKDRAEQAFQAVEKAWSTLSTSEGYERAVSIYDEAKRKTDDIMEEQRKKLKKQGLPPTVPEDDPIKYKQSVYGQACKLFADLERMRIEREKREQAEIKRKAEEEAKEKEKLQQDKEFQKNFEDSREGRVTSWNAFMRTKGGKTGGVRGPKLQAESTQSTASTSKGTFRAANYHSLERDPGADDLKKF